MRRIGIIVSLCLLSVALTAQVLVKPFNRDSMQRVKNPITRDWDIVRMSTDVSDMKPTTKFSESKFNKVFNPITRQYDLVRRTTIDEGTFTVDYDASAMEYVLNPWGSFDLIRKYTPSGGDEPLILEWDDIANVPLCDYSDAPAPGNITITPDAVGDNPVTWYYKVCAKFIIDGVETRTLLSDESSYIVGDATYELIFDCDINDYGQEICYIIIIAGTTTGVYTNVWLKTYTAPSTLVYFECDEIPNNLTTGLRLTVGEANINAAILSIPIYQPCAQQDLTNVDNWNTFFDLPEYGTEFTSVTVDLNEVHLSGGSGITLSPYLFTGMSIVQIYDESGLITSISRGCFANCSSLTSITLAGVTTIVGIGNFAGCTSLTSILTPLCTQLGESELDDSIFANITGLTITVTCDASLLTCNGGAPDGDLCSLASNNTITVNGSPLAGCGD